MRKPCKECPWVVKSNHNDKFKVHINKLTDIGFIDNKRHRCHMIDAKNILVEPTEENICKGINGVN